MRLAATITAAWLVAACTGSDQATYDVDLSAAAKPGATLYANSGCTACHGKYGVGGLGPTLRGLAGTQVELSDGTTVLADSAYLTLSVADPGAQTVAGFGVKMPPNPLSDVEIESIVTYLEEIG